MCNPQSGAKKEGGETIRERDCHVSRGELPELFN